MKKLFILFIIASLIDVSCKTDKLARAEIQTISLTPISPSDITFTGNVVAKGSFKVIDHGFLYGTNSNIDESTGTKISLGGTLLIGEFSKTINGLQLSSSSGNEVKVYARAYVVDEKGITFGEILSTNLLRPGFSQVIPNTGKTGDGIKITGKFYFPSISDVTATLGNVNAKVISSSDTEIVVEVPKGINAGHNSQIKLSMTIKHVTLVPSDSFTILANFKDFSPKLGNAGSLVTFTGDNMPSSSTNNIEVNFNHSVATFDGQQAVVPSTIKGIVNIYVTVNGQKNVLPGEFSVLSPEITSLSPESASPGGTVIIFGTNFPSQGNPMVKLNNGAYTPVTPIGHAISGFTYVVPMNTAPGQYMVMLKIGEYEITSSKKLTIL